MDAISISVESLLRHRFVRHGLAAEPDSLASVTDVDALDLGVQDTGADGSAWALALRGAPTATRGSWDDDLFLAWTLRGAPHAYRRADLGTVADATAPFSDDDAAKRIFDAAKPLRAAGLGILDALGTVAAEQRRIVTKPTVKGDVSGALTGRLDDAFLRLCRPCGIVHVYEQPFRLSALQAGLVLEAGTSPPVLRRVKGFRGPCYSTVGGVDIDPRVDVVRGVLRFAPGSRTSDVVAVVDGAAKDVKARWPADVVTVRLAGDPGGGGPRAALDADAEWLAADAGPERRTVRLLGPFDPYLQLRDRELIVPDAAARKDLWRTLGRPGALVADGEVIGTWRPRSKARSFAIEVDPWGPLRRADATLVEAEAERLAAFRGKPLAAVAIL